MFASVIHPEQWRPMAMHASSDPIAAHVRSAIPLRPVFQSSVPAAEIVRGDQQDATQTVPTASIVDGDPSAYTNLFVAPLPKSVRNDDLLNVFLPFRASHASVMMDVNTGRSKGFGFVAFEDPNDGYAAAQALQGKCYVAPGGDTYTLNISASHHQKSACLNESRHVYFRNIPTMLPVEHVERVLGQFGRIVRMQLRLDSLQRWYMACVEYEDVQSARLAVETGHGKALFPEQSTFPVMVKFADSVPTKGRKGKSKGQRNRPKPQAPVEELTEAPLRDVREVPFAYRLAAGDCAITEFLVDATPAGAVVREDPLHDSGASSNPHQRTLSGGSSHSADSEGSTSSGSSGRYRRNPYDALDVIIPLE